MSATFKILVVDQFAPAPSPYQLSQEPMDFESLCSEQLSRPLTSSEELFGRGPKVLEVTEAYNPQMCTTAFRAAADGTVEVWKYRWDSSG